MKGPIAAARSIQNGHLSSHLDSARPVPSQLSDITRKSAARANTNLAAPATTLPIFPVSSVAYSTTKSGRLQMHPGRQRNRYT